MPSLQDELGRLLRARARDLLRSLRPPTRRELEVARIRRVAAVLGISVEKAKSLDHDIQEARGTYTLKEVGDRIRALGYDGRRWEYDAIRRHLERDRTGFFAEVRACRLGGPRSRFDRPRIDDVIKHHKRLAQGKERSERRALAAAQEERKRRASDMK